MVKMLTFVPNKHIYGIAKIRKDNKKDNNNNLSTHAIMETKTTNTTAEMKAAVKRNYEIMMAAIKVCEAAQVLNEAQAARDTATYDWEHHNKEINDHFFATCDALDAASRKVKTAVKDFFHLCGWNLPEHWRSLYAHEALRAYRDKVRDFALWHIAPSPLAEINILKTC